MSFGRVSILEIVCSPYIFSDCFIDEASRKQKNILDWFVIVPNRDRGFHEFEAGLIFVPQRGFPNRVFEVPTIIVVLSFLDDHL